MLLLQLVFIIIKFEFKMLREEELNVSPETMQAQHSRVKVPGEKDFSFI